jgi:hypothetical protein
VRVGGLGLREEPLVQRRVWAAPQRQQAAPGRAARKGRAQRQSVAPRCTITASQPAR